MNKQLTNAEIEMAGDIFLKIMQPVKTQNFNQQMAECSIRLARIFSAAVEAENNHCNEVEFVKPDSAFELKIDGEVVPGTQENLKKLSNAWKRAALDKDPRFDEMACCFAKFDYFSSGHLGVYKKTKVPSNSSFTCQHAGNLYIAHQYPEWVVAKAMDSSGVIYGFSSSNLNYKDGYWLDSSEATVKICILKYEECLAKPEDSLVSIDLPF